MEKIVTLHKVVWPCPETRTPRFAWFTTWNKAMKFARQQGISDTAAFAVVEVPKSKIGLCEWLNENLRFHGGM
jgi:hypothetical protein